MALIDVARQAMEPTALAARGGARADAPEDDVTVTLVPAAAGDKLLPDWRGLADTALFANPFMAPEFMQPAAVHLARADDMMLAAAWRKHARSRELIGLFALTIQRPRGLRWLQPRTASLWADGAMPLPAVLLSADAAAAQQATAALVGALEKTGVRRVAFPKVEVASRFAEVLGAASAARAGALAQGADDVHSRGLDIMLTVAPHINAVTLAQDPPSLRAMLEQALAMDAATPRQSGDAAPVLFDAQGLAFLRAMVRGFSHTGQIVMARYNEGARKAVAIALMGRERAYLWRLLGPAAHDPKAETALTWAIREATGLPVSAATDYPMAGFCTAPMRTRTFTLDLHPA
jgi:hypothetical protein